MICRFSAYDDGGLYECKDILSRELFNEDLFDTVPITFHIKEMKDEEFSKFQHFYDRSKKKLGKKKTS